jgi:hypothetical protein
MSNDLVPDGSSWWQHLNLPEIVAGPAGKAISRLIGASADIPAAGIERVVQGIRNKTAAKQKISEALADAAAKMVVADQDLVHRAADSFLAKELRRQSNKEAVAQKVLEHLGSAQDQPSISNSEDVEEDWLNVFERYAEDASSERLQDLWGRILAGQIRNPRTFSLSTLRFVSELDQQTASLFEAVSDSIFNGDMIPKTKVESLKSRLQLAEAGLISGAAGGLVTKITCGENGAFMMYRRHAVRVIAKEGTLIGIPAMPLTRVGKEIYSILSPVDSLERAKQLAELVRNIDAVERILYGPLSVDHSKFFDDQAEVLWEKPKPEA